MDHPIKVKAMCNYNLLNLLMTDVKYFCLYLMNKINATFSKNYNPLVFRTRFSLYDSRMFDSPLDGSSTFTFALHYDLQSTALYCGFIGFSRPRNKAVDNSLRFFCLRN